MADGSAREPGRMEAFSDAVFAFGVTVLVADIKVPTPEEGAQNVDLLTTLGHLWPSFVAYVFSFVVIGIYWVNHHYTGKLYVRVDHVFNLLNLLFLMFIAFLPLPTRILASYIVDPANRTTAAAIYTGTLAGAAMAWTLKWLYAALAHGVIDDRLTREHVHRLTRMYVLSAIAYAVCALLTLIEPWLALGAALALTLAYLRTPPAPRYAKTSPG